MSVWCSRGGRILLLAGVLLGVSMVLSPSYGACPPSGGPSEILFLELESVSVDGVVTATATSAYGLERLWIEGVAQAFTLFVEDGDTTVFLGFEK